MKLVIAYTLAGLQLYRDLRRFSFRAQLRAFGRVPGRRTNRLVVRLFGSGPRQQPVFARRHVAEAESAVALDARLDETQGVILRLRLGGGEVSAQPRRKPGGAIGDNFSLQAGGA